MTVTFKNKSLPVFLSAVTMIFLLAFGQSSYNKKVAQTDYTKYEEEVFTIDTFSTFPPEIDGCSCYFSNDSL